MSEGGRQKSRRKYAPAVEALEALRLLSLNAAPLLLPLPVEHGLLNPTPAEAPGPPPQATWDAALGQTALDDLLAPARSTVDPADLQSGFTQLKSSGQPPSVTFVVACCWLEPSEFIS